MISLALPRILGPLLAVSTFPSVLHADVLQVADDGSQPFSDIQAAVDAASDRDTILVNPGQYSGFTINNKYLSVVAAAGGAVEVQGSVLVLNVQVFRTVQLSGLTVQGVATSTIFGHGLEGDNNHGALRIQDCQFAGSAASAFGSGDPIHGADLFLCTDVIVQGCEFNGGVGHLPRAGNGMSVHASMVSIFESRLEGHVGRDWPAYGGEGGRGLRMDTSSLVFLFGSEVRGGDGGTGTDPEVSVGGIGTSAVMVKLTCSLYYGNTEVIGGHGGASASTPVPGYEEFLFGGNGAVFPFTEVERRALLGPARVHAGEDLGVRFEGEPGDRITLYFSGRPYNALHIGFESAWGVNPNSKHTLGPVAVIPESGEVHVNIPTWALGPLTDSSALTFQGRVKKLDGSVTLTNPLFVHLLQCSFSSDCNGNGIPDSCDIQAGTSVDCDGDGIPDSCGYGEFITDCNGNGLPDSCEIASGAASDCNGDSIPDACQVDCNGNGIADSCDLASGFSSDCDGDGVPDECNIDCNNNGVPDACDISAGTSLDLNENGVPDECQVPGTTYYVDDDAGFGGAGTSLAPFRDLGTAVDYALSGDTILLFDGIYSGENTLEMDFGTRELTVQSLNGPANCVIDLENNGRAFLVSGTQSNSTRIDGLTIINGRALSESVTTQGGSAIVVRNASPSIINCVFKDCVAGESLLNGSGTIWIYGNQMPGAGTLIQGCEFLDCTADTGAAIATWDLHGGGLTVLDSIFRNGRASSGAGISCFNSELLVQGCEFTGGFTPGNGRGGAIVHEWNSKPLTVLDTLIQGNVSPVGGGLYTSLSGDVRIENCTLAENFAHIGGAAYIVRSQSNRISHSLFANNTAGYLTWSWNLGGALAFYNGNEFLPTSIDNCLFFGNKCHSPSNGGVGGALEVNNGDDFWVTNSSFFLNTADQGGAIRFGDQSNFGFSGPTVRNSLFWENYADGVREQIRVENMPLDYDYNNNQDGVAGLTLGLGGSLVFGAHNSDFYPGFVDPDGPDDDINTWEDNNVHLSSNSMARDAGDNTVLPLDIFDMDGDGNTTEPVPFDLAGGARLVDSNEPDTGNGTAPIVDLGCYEDQ